MSGGRAPRPPTCSLSYSRVFLTCVTCDFDDDTFSLLPSLRLQVRDEASAHLARTIKESEVAAEARLADALRSNTTIVSMYVNDNTMSEAAEQAIKSIVKQNEEGPAAAAARAAQSRPG